MSAGASVLSAWITSTVGTRFSACNEWNGTGCCWRVRRIRLSGMRRSSRYNINTILFSRGDGIEHGQLKDFLRQQHVAAGLLG